VTVDELKAGTSIPVITAPMFLVSGIDLIAAVCAEGLIGSFPAINARTPDIFAEWLEALQARLGPDAKYGVNLVLRSPMLPQHLDICERYRVPLIISSVGNPAEVTKRVHGWGGVVIHDVTTVRHAQVAAEAGVDGLILVCAGAGGHSGSLSAFTFAREVRRFFDRTLVIGGGIGDGAAILAAEVLGADFAYMGTRFIATQESIAPDDYKQMMLRAGSSDIVYTDRISGLRANFMRQSLIDNGLDPDDLPPMLVPQTPNLPGDLKAWKHLWSAGHAVGLVDSIPTAGEVCATLKREYAEAVAAFARRASTLPA
jgi:nitronate monooxygenase